jgi:hypothetical protein
MRKCGDCGRIGNWRVYCIWDKNKTKIGSGKRKHWLCPACDKKDETK